MNCPLTTEIFDLGVMNCYHAPAVLPASAPGHTDQAQTYLYCFWVSNRFTSYNKNWKSTIPIVYNFLYRIEKKKK